MDLALVLIGGEEADHPSRHHVAQVTEDAACLVHLRQEDKGPSMRPLLKPHPKKAPNLRAPNQVQRLTGECGQGDLWPGGTPWSLGITDWNVPPSKHTQLLLLVTGSM